MRLSTTVLGLLLTTLVLSPAQADSAKGSTSGKGSASGHSAGQTKGSASGETMKMEAPAGITEAKGEGVINTVDATGGKVNLTHDPIEELKWPKMTMDLPVTRRVDLAEIKPGTKVTFKLKLGRDKQYRVIELTPAK